MPRTAAARNRLAETDSPLHRALRQKPYTLEAVQAVIDAAGGDNERRELVNRRDLQGNTPLLLAIGHLSGLKMIITPDQVEEVVDVLLENGARDTILAFSRTRQKASDQATNAGLHRIAAKLSELEKLKLQEELQCSAGYAREGMMGARGNICTICGDKISVDCKIGNRRAAVNCGEEDNPLIQKFFEGEYISEMRMPLLSSPALHHVNRRKNFAKELTDSLGVFFSLLETLDRLQLRDVPFHVVDLCCGKGLTAALVGVVFPNASVTAFDRLREAYLPHYSEAGLNNVSYECVDILSDSFFEKFREVVAKANHRPVVVLGMHLCGVLSLRAVELLAEQDVRAILLAPCCLPGRKSPLAEELFADCIKDKKFERWCDHLEHLMLKAKRYEGKLPAAMQSDTEDYADGVPPESPQVDRLTIHGMLAQKNTVLSAVYAA